MNKAPVNLAIIGLGKIAQEHLKAWRTIDKIRVAAVCDTNKSIAEKMATDWGISAHYDDFGELLKAQPISIVDICTPPQSHCSLILQALEAGCHVIVEKPLTMTTEEAKEIISRQKGGQAKVTVIHNWLYVPVMRKALSLIRKGRLGKVNSVEIKALHTPGHHMFSEREHWCHSLPGGRMGEMLAHPIYLMQAILGQLKVKSVQAMKLGNHPWVRCDELQVSLEANGGSASIYISFNSCREDMLIDIYGTGGKLRIEQLSDIMVQSQSRPLANVASGIDSLQQAYQLALSTATSAVTKLSGRWTGGPEFCLRAFADSVLNDKEPLVTLSQAYDTVELLEQLCQEIESQ